MTDERCTQLGSAGGQPERSDRPELARHLIACTPCGVQLDRMAGERDVLQFLVRTVQVAEPRPFVERVLAASAEEGRRELADLLYELAKACIALSTDEGVGRPVLYRLIERPRAKESVTNDIDALAGRLGSGEGRAEVDSPPSASGFPAAETCATILRSLEGDSPRTKQVRGIVLLGMGRASDALPLFEEVALQTDDCKHQLSASRNLVGTLIRLKRFDEAVSQAETILQRNGSDRWALLHLAIAHVWRSDLKAFDSTAQRFSTITAGEPDASWWIEYLEDQALWMAEQTKRPVESIRTAFSVEALARGRE